MYGVWYDGGLYNRPPPTSGQNWINAATQIGSTGWDSYKFLFFHPNGLLYGVKDGKIYSGAPPTDPSVDWSADLVGGGGWDAFKFLFFDPSGNLYGVIQDKFRKGDPPSLGVNWVATSQLLGSSGWSSFQHLFIMADGQLYGVHEDKLYKLFPETDCFGNVEVIGSSGWSQFTFLMSPLE